MQKTQESINKDLEELKNKHTETNNTITETKLKVLRRKWQHTPVLLPGKSHGRRSLIDYNQWGHKESDMTEATQQQQWLI